LKCRWLDENGIWSQDRFVTLEDFLYDEENHKPYIYDADKAYCDKHPEIVEKRKNLEHSREDIPAGVIERQKREEEQAAKNESERMTLQKLLQEDGRTVELFRSGTKCYYCSDKSLRHRVVISKKQAVRIYKLGDSLIVLDVVKTLP